MFRLSQSRLMLRMVQLRLREDQNSNDKLPNGERGRRRVMCLDNTTPKGTNLCIAEGKEVRAVMLIVHI
jgi:hypothetical protein